MSPTELEIGGKTVTLSGRTSHSGCKKPVFPNETYVTISSPINCLRGHSYPMWVGVRFSDAKV